MNKECADCKQSKPYPGDYITSFKKMVIVSQCKDCRAKIQKGHRQKAQIKGVCNHKFNDR